MVHPSFDGFTLEEVMTRDLPDGTTARAALCMVCTVTDGKITGVVEYADAEQVRAVNGR